MRTVAVYLKEVTESQATDFLTRAYPSQSGPPWIENISGDPCLYINFAKEILSESEPEESLKVIEALGGSPQVVLTADVSGRHLGRAEVRKFVISLLERFTGVAEDDYSTHLWSLTEIASNKQINGLFFFDPGGKQDLEKDA